MNVRRGTVVAFLILAVAVASARAEDRAANELAVATERVVVLKDGYALVVKHATGTSDEEGVVYTDDVPDAAILGSFWAVPSDGRLIAMTAGLVTVENVEKVRTSAVSYASVLQMNREQAATLRLDDGSSVAGTIRDVLGGQLAVIRTETGDVTVPVARIRELSMREMALEEEVVRKSESKKKRLSFRFEGGAAERELTILYFRPGIRWIPTYRIELPEAEEDDTARIALQAELLNEAEDLTDVKFDLVVGVPNFRFRDVVSPFTLERALRNALVEAAPQVMSQNGMSNAYFSNRAGESRGRYEAPSGGETELPPELEAGGSQDLYVYSFPAMSLAKGERAALPVFDARVPVAHVYTWEVAVAREDILLAPSGKGDVSPLAISAERVWHLIGLSNATKVPWTTGTAMIFEGGRPLAQELMTYTPVGGAVRVPLTVAVDVRGDYASMETGRELDSLKWDRSTYAKIAERGTLTLRNFKGTDVTVEVLCRVAGRVDEASEGAEIEIGAYRPEDWRNYRGHPAVNNSSAVRFRVDLAAGGSAKLWFTSHFFVRQ